MRRGPGRRQVLAGIGAAALAGRARGAVPEGLTLVVGAGLAGLTVARRLAEAGAAVQVIEARDRIGGRIATSRAWPDLPVDPGASWIHGTRGNPLTALAEAAGARRVATDYAASVLYGPGGGAIDPDLAPAERLIADALRAAERSERDVSVAEAIRTSRDWQAAGPELRRLVDYLVNSTLEQEYGGPAGQLSAWWGLEGEEFGGPDVLFPDGFDRVAAHLARGLDIRPGAAVAEIAPGGVRLAGGARIAAERVVCTVPLGVLRAGALAFAEPLSPGRQAAIAGLRMGLLNKCWLRFERVVWPDDVDWIGWLGPEAGVWAEWVSLARATGAPVLVGFNAAEAAAAIEGRDDRTTVAAAVGALRAMFGAGFPAPVAAQVTRWGRDPWARGSYSFTAVGTSPETRRALAGADWEGRLWFAGEAASPLHFGTAHGAVLSGEAVAAAILGG